jgi:hypothetical protein
VPVVPGMRIEPQVGARAARIEDAA